MDVARHKKNIRFRDIHGPKPYKLIGFRWALLSQMPVVLPVPDSASGAGFGRKPVANGPQNGLKFRAFFGPGGLGPALGTFALGFWPKPFPNRPKILL